MKLTLRIVGVLLIALGVSELLFWEPASLLATHPEFRWLDVIASRTRWVTPIVYLWLGYRLVRDPLWPLRRSTRAQAGTEHTP